MLEATEKFLAMEPGFIDGIFNDLFIPSTVIELVEVKKNPFTNEVVASNKNKYHIHEIIYKRPTIKSKSRRRNRPEIKEDLLVVEIPRIIYDYNPRSREIVVEGYYLMKVRKALSSNKTFTPIVTGFEEFRTKVFPGGAEALREEIMNNFTTDYLSKNGQQLWVDTRYRPGGTTSMGYMRHNGRPFSKQENDAIEISNQGQLLNLLAVLEQILYFKDNEPAKTIATDIGNYVGVQYKNLKQAQADEEFNTLVNKLRAKENYSLINLNKGEAVPYSWAKPEVPQNLLNAPKYNKNAIDKNLSNIFGIRKSRKASRRLSRKTRKA